MDDERPTKLALLQPTRRREWEIRRGDELLAELRLPSMKRGGTARVGDRELEIRVSGLFKPEHLVIDAATGEEVARVRQSTLERPGLEPAKWKSLGRGQGQGFVGADGESWLRGNVSSGIFRTTGQIEVDAGPDPALPALVAAYLLIRKAEEAAGAVSATVAAT
jgi:hypothetical protein